MSDDIVTQLVMFSLDDGTDALNKLLVEAVNEIERLRAENNFSSIPTLGSVRERLGYFACKTEEGELNTVLNNAYTYIYKLEKEIEHLNGVVDNGL